MNTFVMPTPQTAPPVQVPDSTSQFSSSISETPAETSRGPALNQGKTPDPRLSSKPTAESKPRRSCSRMGRPTALSEEMAESLCELVRAEGISDTQAGRILGVARQTLSRWKLEDEDFAERLGQARAEFQRAHLQNVLTARKRDGSQDWRASAWILQRMFPEQYGSPAQRQRAEQAEREEMNRLRDEIEREKWNRQKRVTYVPKPSGSEIGKEDFTAKTPGRQAEESNSKTQSREVMPTKVAHSRATSQAMDLQSSWRPSAAERGFPLGPDDFGENAQFSPESRETGLPWMQA